MSYSNGQTKCAFCGGPLAGHSNEEEMNKEHNENFPGMSLETAVIICDDCYNMTTSEIDPKEWTGTQQQE